MWGWLRKASYAHLLKECLRIDEFGMALHGRHVFDKTDTGGVEGADDEAGEARRKRGHTLPVLARDGVPMTDMCNGVDQVLSAVTRKSTI